MSEVATDHRPKSDWDPALKRLFNALPQLPSSEEDVTFLSNLLQSKQLHALVSAHNTILRSCVSGKFFPMLSTSMNVMIDVLEVLASRIHLSEDCQELFYILQKPHIQGVLYSHDVVAQKDYYPHLPEVPRDDGEEEQTVKIVQLVKSSEPLTGTDSTEPIVGATIKSDEETGKIIIARVMRGGAADRSGLIHVGDEVIEVNNFNVEGKTPNDVLQILQNSEGTITFKLIPADGRHQVRESKVRVRAHFAYNSANDPYIPCKEAGLNFEKGDVLHIVSQDDAYWWQARRENDTNMRAGLIPSKALQERRIIQERTETDVDNGLCSESAMPVLSCSQTLLNSPECTSKHKTKKIMYDTAEFDDFDREHIATYEEVAKLYPRVGFHRPLVLIGPRGVGRNELRRRLHDIDPEKYRSPIPYTSRPMKPGEVNGKDYFFVSRLRMEEDINVGKFLESGEYKGNLYGTSMESVRAVIDAGKVCILTPHYNALKALRNPQLKPFVIYVKPPELEVLKETRRNFRARSTHDVNNYREFTVRRVRFVLPTTANGNFKWKQEETACSYDVGVAATTNISPAVNAQLRAVEQLLPNTHLSLLSAFQFRNSRSSSSCSCIIVPVPVHSKSHPAGSHPQIVRCKYDAYNCHRFRYLTAAAAVCVLVTASPGARCRIPAGAYYARGAMSPTSSTGPHGGAATAARGGTLLGIARSGDEQRLRELVRSLQLIDTAPDDLDATDGSGRSSVSYIASNGFTDILEQLLCTHSLDTNKPDNEGNTPLHFAAQAGHADCLSFLVNRCRGIEIDARNHLGITPLMKAAIQGRNKCAKLLLFAGANPTLRDDGRGFRADQWARYCGRYICADVIEKYARPRLLERSTPYGNWGSDSELRTRAFMSKALPMPSNLSSPPVHGFKSRLKRVFRTSNPTDDSLSSARLITQLTSAALCASFPVLPSVPSVPPIVKSLIRPLIVPRVQITLANNNNESLSSSICSNNINAHNNKKVIFDAPEKKTLNDNNNIQSISDCTNNKNIPQSSHFTNNTS